ncbi:MAG TPA: phosphoglycerate kinase [Polyangiaceae bacterium]
MTTLNGLLTIDQLEIENQRVLVRLDLDAKLAPPEEGGDLELRVNRALPTLRHIVEHGGKVIVLGHRGRPKGRADDDLGLEPLAQRIAESSGWDVLLPDDCVGEAAQKAVLDLRAGQIVVLENLRFYPEEEAGDERFAHRLARFGDLYVNDALAASNRPHCSVYQLPKLFRQRAIGFAVKEELTALQRITNPSQPLTALLGGTRLAERAKLIESLLVRGNQLCIGGALGSTLLAAKGHRIGMTRVDLTELARARTLLEQARDRDVAIHLPSDATVTESDDASEGRTVAIADLAEHDRIVDIGPETQARFRAAIASTDTALWVGAMGTVGQAAFAVGTHFVATALAESMSYGVVLGAAAIGAAQQLAPELVARLGHLSTGAGASLELLEGKRLPGIEVLRMAE